MSRKQMFKDYVNYDKSTDPRILNIKKSDKIYFWSIKSNELIKLRKQDKQESKCQMCIPKYQAFTKPKACDTNVDAFCKAKRHYMYMENRFGRQLVWANKSEIPSNLRKEREFGDFSSLENDESLCLEIGSTRLINKRNSLLNYLKDGCPCNLITSSDTIETCSAKINSLETMFNHLANVERSLRTYVLYKVDPAQQKFNGKSSRTIESNYLDSSDSEEDYDDIKDKSYNSKISRSSIQSNDDRSIRSMNRRKLNNGRVYKSTGGLNTLNDEDRSEIKNFKNNSFSSVSSTQANNQNLIRSNNQKSKFNHSDNLDKSVDSIHRTHNKKPKIEIKNELIDQQSNRELIGDPTIIQKSKSKSQRKFVPILSINSKEKWFVETNPFINQNSEIRNSKLNSFDKIDNSNVNNSTKIHRVEYSDSEDEEEMLVNQLYAEMKSALYNKLSNQMNNKEETVDIKLTPNCSKNVIQDTQDDEVIVLD